MIGLGELNYVEVMEVKNTVSQKISNLNNNFKGPVKRVKKTGQKLDYQAGYWSDKTKYSKLENINLNAIFPKEKNEVLGIVDLLDVAQPEKRIISKALLDANSGDLTIKFIN